MNRFTYYLSLTIRTICNFLSIFIYIILLFIKTIVTFIYVICLIFYSLTIDFITDKILTNEIKDSKLIKWLVNFNKEMDLQ